ncbi:LOW QUALITY PROTEIN: adenosine receptor A2b-like [Xenia sp. Carnegie-2017]|uniref:LOW QUALITY PROTEIN: adenosine receptor A2b-like n=1 Tax=Xenia sp. Carnegie-2017 TaxID=2897299 RepID=UPI001F044CC9|nr:LOW QUALITY PROTEIN: adenosine receptor A2b-like [Xenia sp. Carnegie-2017]
MSSNSSENGTNFSINATLLDVQIAFLIATIIMSVLGNTLVIMAIYFDRRLRTINNYFVGCLAVSDILVALISVLIRTLILLNIRKPFSENLVGMPLCRFLIWMDTFSESASTFTLILISIERYFKICQSFLHRERMTNRFAKYAIVILWIIAALPASLAMVPFGDKGITISGNHCLSENKVFYLWHQSFFFLPLLVYIVIFTIIFYTICNPSQQFHETRFLNSGTRQNDQYPSSDEVKTTKTMFIVAIAFVVCWGPFFILLMLIQYRPRTFRNLGKKWPILRVVFLSILPSANSFFNPIIYACFDNSYRRAFKITLLKMIGCFGSRTNFGDLNQRREGPSWHEMYPNPRISIKITSPSSTTPENTTSSTELNDSRGIGNSLSVPR